VTFFAKTCTVVVDVLYARSRIRYDRAQSRNTPRTITHNGFKFDESPIGDQTALNAVS
jgi:hypothetical protein